MVKRQPAGTKEGGRFAPSGVADIPCGAPSMSLGGGAARAENGSDHAGTSGPAPCRYTGDPADAVWGAGDHPLRLPGACNGEMAVVDDGHGRRVQCFIYQIGRPDSRWMWVTEDDETSISGSHDTAEGARESAYLAVPTGADVRLATTLVDMGPYTGDHTSAHWGHDWRGERGCEGAVVHDGQRCLAECRVYEPETEDGEWAWETEAHPGRGAGAAIRSTASTSEEARKAAYLVVPDVTRRAREIEEARKQPQP